MPNENNNNILNYILLVLLFKHTHSASVFQCDSLQCVRFVKLVSNQVLAVPDVIAGTAILLQGTGRLTNRLLLGIEEVFVVHVRNDLNKLREIGI